MLKVIYSLHELKYSQLMDVYYEGNMENAALQYPRDEANVALIRAEQDFYTYLSDCFFQTEKAFYAIWEENCRYVSALRMEPYQDGWLLEALETAPDFRRMGYARKLIEAMIELLEVKSPVIIYSHIHKDNAASLAAHKVCGFEKILDHALYIDGTVRTNSCTLMYRSKQGKRC